MKHAPRKPSYVDPLCDPAIEEILAIIRKEKAALQYIEDKSGVTTQTLRNWRNGVTRRPQVPTVRAVAKSLGYDFRFVKTRNSR
jgi:transcriptional regulator with XRE-family HTH domain